MDVVEHFDAPCSPAELFTWVDDLARYPAWLSIVTRADAEPAGDAWAVELRGRVGPLARSKRLRMVRTVLQPPRSVRFERSESDGRSHAPWVLEATVDGVAEASRLTMALHYGGGWWGPVLERVLRDEIERSRPTLLGLVSGPTR